MPAVFGEREIPGYIKTEDEAVEYAKSYSKEKQKMLWLVLSRGNNIHIDSDGKIKSRYELTWEENCMPVTIIR